MGYTHYWNNKFELTDDLIQDVYKILKVADNRGISIRGGLGNGKPVANLDEIRFNGDKKLGEDYETFALLGDDFQFCKTARQPYDLAVCLVLLRTYALNKGRRFSFNSDGSWNDEAWKNARDTYREIFGEDAKCPPKMR